MHNAEHSIQAYTHVGNYIHVRTYVSYVLFLHHACIYMYVHILWQEDARIVVSYTPLHYIHTYEGHSTNFTSNALAIAYLEQTTCSNEFITPFIKMKPQAKHQQTQKVYTQKYVCISNLASSYVTESAKSNILNNVLLRRTCTCKFTALNIGNINGCITKRCSSLTVKFQMLILSKLV